MPYANRILSPSALPGPGGAALPTSDNVNESALTGDEVLTSASAPFQFRTPDSNGYKIELPPTFPGNTISLSNEHATYTYAVHQHSGGAQLLLLENAHGVVTFTRRPGTGDWGL